MLVEAYQAQQHKCKPNETQQLELRLSFRQLSYLLASFWWHCIYASLRSGYMWDVRCGWLSRYWQMLRHIRKTTGIVCYRRHCDINPWWELHTLSVELECVVQILKHLQLSAICLPSLCHLSTKTYANFNELLPLGLWVGVEKVEGTLFLTDQRHTPT